jgi:hypothetical protein
MIGVTGRVGKAGLLVLDKKQFMLAICPFEKLKCKRFLDWFITGQFGVTDFSTTEFANGRQRAKRSVARVRSSGTYGGGCNGHVEGLLDLLHTHRLLYPRQGTRGGQQTLFVTDGV